VFVGKKYRVTQLDLFRSRPSQPNLFHTWCDVLECNSLTGSSETVATLMLSFLGEFGSAIQWICFLLPTALLSALFSCGS
jgi:hypothetical protein